MLDCADALTLIEFFEFTGTWIPQNPRPILASRLNLLVRHYSSSGWCFVTIEQSVRPGFQRVGKPRLEQLSFNEVSIEKDTKDTVRIR